MVVAAMALAGCGSSGGTSAADSRTVAYMSWETNDANAALDKSMASFSKSSGITVKREAAPNADYAQKLASMIQSKKAPNFFWCTPAQAQNLMAEGLLFDWKGHLDKNQGIKTSEFSPGSLDPWRTKDDKLAGVPTLANTYGFFYNADMFKKAGIAEPRPGWTWDDLFSAMDKFKAAKPKSTPLVAQWTLLESLQGVSAYSESSGGRPFVDSWVHVTKVNADSHFVASTEKFATAIKQGRMTNPDYDATNSMAAFSNGDFPLLFGGQWLQEIIGPNNPKFDYGFAPWPAGSAKNIQPVETNGICSPSTLKNPDETWKAMSYLEATGFNAMMKAVPVAPVSYQPGSKGYYENLAGQKGLAAQTIAATVKYELGAQNKFETGFLDPWATKADGVVKTSWNPTLESRMSADRGVAATVKGIQGLADQQNKTR